jgi:putative flavoprotein involved in K+ transport
MPEMHFLIEWPDGSRDNCYSPSYVIEEHLTVGHAYTLDAFLERVTEALQTASERVQARYGFACSSALDQLAALKAKIAVLRREHGSAQIKVLAFEKHAARDARADARGPAGRANSERVFPVIVVGGGQAGLSVSYCLKEAAIEHVVFERSRIGSSWRTQRWDSFCLVTPNWQCQLPGYPYVGPEPDGFMNTAEIIQYLEGYVRSFLPPVREGVHVLSVERGHREPFVVTTSLGTFAAAQVVIATGGYHVPRIPDVARGLPAEVMQLHSADYRNPRALPAGEVLVVGTGQSGCQIAEDLFLAGRKVHLSVGPAPRCARRYRGRDVVEWLQLMGHYDLPIDKHPNKEAARDKTNHYVTGRDGGHDIDLRKFALEGMRLYGPLDSIAEGRITFSPSLKRNLDDADAVYDRINRSIDAYIEKVGIHAPFEAPYVPVWEPDGEPASLDCRRSNIRSVVWSVGFGMDFSWVKVPAFDARGYPLHQRGVAPIEGLYFIGLPWLYTWGSGRFCGVGRDAHHIVERIGQVAKRSHAATRADSTHVANPPDR